MGSHVLYLDTETTPLPAAMRETYLADLQAWVLDGCRRAIRAGVATRRIARAATSLCDALFGWTGPACKLDRWHSIGPHAIVRRTANLSPEAIAIVLYAAAPELWGNMALVYRAISASGRGVADRQVLGALLGDPATVARELAPTAALIQSGLVTVGVSGEVSVDRVLLCRLAGA
ncbi:MAG TPA: hypothetical protein VL326_31800 [Kofleriaceae bacterium]|jgi:hypothetical protein|nr:hypothetical protein [Kofleriaceae bacterium]